MTKINDIILEQRNEYFVPDEYRALIICETRFDFMKDVNKCMQAAEEYHNYLSKERRFGLEAKLLR